VEDAAACRRAGAALPGATTDEEPRDPGCEAAWQSRGGPPNQISGRSDGPDLVQRDFTASRPNELWVADISYLRCWEGLVFFAFVIDAFSRKIVGWQLATHVRTDLVLDALKMALAQRGPGADVELIHHSDRGSQYTSIDYTQTLTDHRVLASVGSVGDAYDNALAESFVDSFKTELITDRVWRSRSQLELAIVEYLSWFNNSRLHESLGDIPPAEYEEQHTEREPITLVRATV
jgi:putative transposase